MPFLTRTITSENDGLSAFAAQQLRQIAASLHGLSDEQIRSTPSASGMSLGALARHVLFVSSKGLLAQLDPEFVPDSGAYDDADWAAGGILPGAVRPGDTAQVLIDELRAQADWVEKHLATADLERPVPVPDQPWFPDDLDSWPMRWVALHAVEEYARHAGHADILRESIDGKGAYELNDLADGVAAPVA
ncbi:DUF664 domain-containing protein [Tomitella fengzijianii]|uniref:DUF664 domain-containing protein n=1 Tax=Tomitella fengzijianii TaxID=2597660 RepID=A0A516X3I1_9ACTN|nr:DUF664 domain-containing protein [Tomitella fengzijianii]QDQ97573.1 DUF664 domain-containing protein [Tomitella fengzijianii]